MTEDQIERKVERIMDGLDARFMAGAVTQAQYDEEVRAIKHWADREWRIQKRMKPND